MTALFQLLTRIRVIRFLLSGGIAATMHIAIVYILTEMHNVWYLYATTVGFLIAVSINFLLQKFWTFGEASGQLARRQSTSFFLVNSINIVINAVLMTVFVELLGVAPPIAQAGASGLIAGESFVVYTHIFRTS